MKSTLTAGLTGQQLDDLKQEYFSSPHLRQRLTEILNTKIETGRTFATSKDRYDSPSWAMIQADAIGYERALREVISLLSSK
jgi:hypothetical protein